MADNGGKKARPPGRNDRLAAALRENLKRRKAQERARQKSGIRNQGSVPKKPDSCS
jgi:hypothetical protein